MFFCLTAPKHFVEEPFCTVFQNILVAKILRMRRRESIKIFRRKIIVSLPKNFVGEPFSVSLISGIEIIYASEGYVTIFLPKFFVSQHRNISQKNLSVLCFRKFLVAKKFMDKSEGEISRFPSKISCLIVPKKLVDEPFSVSLFSGIEKFYASEGYVTIFRPKFFVSQCRKIS